MRRRSSRVRRPVKRRSTRKVSRRSYKKRSLRPRFRTGVPRSLLPWRKKVQFIYADSVTLDLETAGAAVRAFRFFANGMYDPAITSSGVRNAQPRLFDQASTLYGKYLVIGSKIQVSFAQTKSNTEAYFIGLSKNRDPLYPRTDIYEYVENRDSKIVQQHEQVNGKVPYLTMGFSINRDLNKTNAMDVANTTGAAFNANPDSQVYYDIIGGSSDGSGQNGPILTCNIRITYIAVLFEPNIVAAS